MRSGSRPQAGPRIIFTGTDPDSRAGGIGVVMRGYFNALESAGISFESIPTFHPGRAGGGTVLWLAALPKLIRTIRRIKKKGEQPIVYSQAGNGFSLFREFFVLLFSRLAGARTILHIHAPQAYYYFDNPVYSILFKIALLPAHMVFVLTDWWKEFFVTRGGIRKPLAVIHNPLSPDLEQIANTPRDYGGLAARHGEKVRILAMARLVPGKGVEIAIQAMALLPSHVQLAVAGEGSERKMLEKLSRELGLADRVFFKGWVSGKEKEELLEDADIFCLPSTNDAYPISFVEAMCYGIPVVGVHYAGIPDIVVDGRVGYLVKEAEARLVAGAIARLLTVEERRALGTAGKPWILERSSPKSIGARLRTIIDNGLL
ncbi:MAG: glycosyltransferase family 4 protein [Desulfobacterales bacterium]|nr:glycosyltransferase family 4 protein [Desulfobacterales bacterium]